ncbi:MAG: hypothetical protein J7L64_03210 [Acidobacteria bacterium]|nr:hypothetical protein [Acidobacteriota bacterium]
MGFLDNLPDIIEYEEEDLSHLDPQMKEVLYPERHRPPFTITLAFSPIDHPAYPEAVSLAKKAPHYHEEGEGKFKHHLATYGIEDVPQMFQLVEVLNKLERYQVLVNKKRIPYARELWLPFMWIFLP